MSNENDGTAPQHSRLRRSWPCGAEARSRIGGDGQVTVGETVMKSHAQKVRVLRGGKVVAGFAGAAADAMTLFEKFEEKLERYPGNLPRAAVELAKDWRSDRVLRRLEAMLIIADKDHGFIVSGTGELIEPDDGILAIGSGGSYALAAARALADTTQLERPTSSSGRMNIAGEICIYTNTNISVLESLRPVTLRPVRGAPRPPPYASTRTQQALARLADLTPRQIAAELDRYIVGQAEAKKAVAIALRNRWRRQRAPDSIRDEISPNNIILIGPTGVGKTEIARRLAKLAGAPFIKVEASKFTEVGYVGRDVESMVRDLVESAIDMVRSERESEVEDLAHERVEERLLDLLLPPPAPPQPGARRRRSDRPTESTSAAAATGLPTMRSASFSSPAPARSRRTWTSRRSGTSARATSCGSCCSTDDSRTARSKSRSRRSPRRCSTCSRRRARPRAWTTSPTCSRRCCPSARRSARSRSPRRGAYCSSRSSKS